MSIVNGFEQGGAKVHICLQKLQLPLIYSHFSERKN